MSSLYSFRIKTDTSATNSSVSNITYSVSVLFLIENVAEFL